MLARSIGSLLVLHDDGSLAGIITERDFLYNVAKNADTWETVRIGDVMIKNVLTASADETTFQNELMKRYIKDWPEEDKPEIATQ